MKLTVMRPGIKKPFFVQTCDCPYERTRKVVFCQKMLDFTFCVKANNTFIFFEKHKSPCPDGLKFQKKTKKTRI